MKVTQATKDNIVKLVIWSGVVVGGVFAVKAIVKAIQDSQGGGDLGGDESKANITDKIKSLQTLIGTYPDGIVGPKTKAALSALGLTTVVDSGTIDTLISMAQSKTTATNLVKARTALASKYIALVKSGYNYYKFKTAYDLSKYTYDAVSKKMVNINEKITLQPSYAYNVKSMNMDSDGFLYINWVYGAKPGQTLYIGKISPWSVNFYTAAQAKELNFKLA